MTRRVDFFYDFVSPYSFLASTQIEGVCARTGAELSWKPFLLGAVFKATNNSSPITVPAKAGYMMEDLQRWSEFYGVEMHMPTPFPINGLLSARAALAAEAQGQLVAFSHATFAAYWRDGRDVSQPDVLQQVAAAVGLDGAALLEAAGSQPIKDRLRENTDQAVALGAFGAPTMVLDGALYWGNDRLQLLEHALTRE